MASSTFSRNTLGAGSTPDAVEELTHYEEISDDAGAQSDEADDSIDNPDGESFSERYRSLKCTVLSAVMHMTVLVVLSLVLGEITEPPPAKMTVEVAEWNRQPELMRFELEPELALVNERSAAIFSESSFASSAASEVGGGGGGGGGGGSSGGGSMIGGVGPGRGGGGTLLDGNLLDQVGSGSGTGNGLGGIDLDMPSARTLIAKTPDGQLGQARAIVQGYDQALDRLTHEILWMLDKGPVLLIWAFDQSESMQDDQDEIRTRLEHVYDQLGLVGPSSSSALETAVVSYGESMRVHTRKPTHDREEIRSAIAEVPVDKSGIEMMCSTIIQTLSTHRQYAERTRRQLMLVVVTDETGERKDNDAQLERVIAEAKSSQCKIYCMGREAVFGYPYAHIRWIHPQTARHHWIAIDRGPETAFVEQLQTDGFHRRYDAHPAGFGPYECTRMCQETGGVFFLLPSLETNLVRGEKRNYELEALLPYLPDIRSRLEVKAEIDQSALRTMLQKVVYDLNPYNPEAQKIIEMRVEFSRDPAAFIRQARQEQAKAIVYLQYLERAQKEVERMERQRRDEAAPRWQANYDLLLAQLIAYQARMYEYGAYLEEFLKKPKTAPPTRPPNLTHVTWDIRTRKVIITGDKVQPYIDRATVLFKQVMVDHAGTPWAYRAQHELNRGFGVELIPDYDAPNRYTGSAALIPVPKM